MEPKFQNLEKVKYKGEDTAILKVLNALEDSKNPDDGPVNIYLIMVGDTVVKVKETDLVKID